MPRDRPDLNGLRIRPLGESGVYLMDEGKKRGIPDANVYWNLFRDDKEIHDVEDINEINTGPNIPETALLFDCSDIKTVWFLDGESPNQVKRGIDSDTTFNFYHFDWNKVNHYNVPLGSLKYPTGDTISRPAIADEFDSKFKLTKKASRISEYL